MTEVKKRFDELDGLKIFFALGIVLFHYPVLGGDNCPKISSFIYTYGHLCVEFFFILSGFLMEHTYRKIIDNFTFPQFMGRRLKTLYPSYLCAELLGLFITFIEFILCQGAFLYYKWPHINVANCVRSFSMTTYGWNIGEGTFMETTWYINILVLCYMLYFVVLRLARYFRIKSIYCYIAVMLFAWGFFHMDSNFPFLLSDSCRGYWSFFVGCILYNIHQSKVFSKKVYILVLDFIVLSVFAAGLKFGIENIFGDVRESLVFLVYPVLILTVENLPAAKKLFSCKVLASTGKYSMDIYLTHMAVYWLIIIFNEYFGWNIKFASYKILGCVLLIIFISSLVWHWLMTIVTPAFNRWFLSFISPAKAEIQG